MYDYPIGTVLCDTPCEACNKQVPVSDMCEDGICLACEEEIFGDLDGPLR